MFSYILRCVEHKILRQIAGHEIALAGNFAAVRVLQPGEDFQERRLAAAVASDEADAVAFLDAERNIVKHGVLVIAHGDVGGGNDGGHANFRISKRVTRDEQQVKRKAAHGVFLCHLSLAVRLQFEWTFSRAQFNNYFMNLIKCPTREFFSSKLIVIVFLTVLAGAMAGFAQSNLPVVQIQADKVTAKMPPAFYGLMTEENNYSYEGGLYGELIRNRAFKASSGEPRFWNTVGSAKMMLDTNTSLNEALNVSLKLNVAGASKKSPAGIANGGYWGIPVKPNTTYHASFYAKAKNFSGALTVSLVHVVGTNEGTVSVHALNDSKNTKGFDWFLGEMTLTTASATVPKISGEWQKYEMTLTTGDVAPSKENRLVISTTKPGTLFNHHSTVWLQQISLFPTTR